MINSHPDRALYADFDTADSSGSPTKWNVNFARYQADAGTGQARKPVDSNYAYQDCSVHLLRQVTLDYDERMAQVPFATMNGNWSLWTYQLPRQ